MITPELPTAAELRSRAREWLTGAAYLGLIGLGVQAGSGKWRAVCIGLLAGVGLMASAAAWRRARTIADIATSRIGSAAQGYVELTGRTSVAPHELITSPVSALACIWYRFRIYTREGNDGEWRLTNSGTSSATFELDDGSGTCRVDPDDAEVVSPEVRTTHAAGEKRVEELLFGGCRLYVLGEFVTRSGAGMALSVREDVGALLADWKRDPAELRRRFDRNGDGQIDLAEWEAARREATRAVEQQHRELREQDDLHVIRAPRDGRLFLISPLAPQTLRRRFLLWSAAHLAVAVVAIGLLLGGVR